jgi:hypothetical protein
MTSNGIEGVAVENWLPDRFSSEPFEADMLSYCARSNSHPLSTHRYQSKLASYSPSQRISVRSESHAAKRPVLNLSAARSGLVLGRFH